MRRVPDVGSEERGRVGNEKKAEQGGLQMASFKNRTAGPVGKACGSSALEAEAGGLWGQFGLHSETLSLGGKKNKKQKHPKPKLLLPQTTAKNKASGVAVS